MCNREYINDILGRDFNTSYYEVLPIAYSPDELKGGWLH